MDVSSSPAMVSLFVSLGKALKVVVLDVDFLYIEIML